jgi:hypothetical protein
MVQWKMPLIVVKKGIWQKTENAGIRSKGWKSQMQGEHASAAVNQDSGTEIGVEFILKTH